MFHNYKLRVNDKTYYLYVLGFTYHNKSTNSGFDYILNKILLDIIIKYGMIIRNEIINDIDELFIEDVYNNVKQCDTPYIIGYKK
jgi:hypothetical protein